MRIYVRNFRNGIREKKLKRFFAKCGYVEDVTIWWDSDSRSLKAYVEMPEDDAERAIGKLNGRYWHGRRLKVSKAKTDPESSETTDSKGYLYSDEDY